MIVTICLVFAFGMVVQCIITGISWNLLMRQSSFRQGVVQGIATNHPEDVTLSCPVCKMAMHASQRLEDL